MLEDLAATHRRELERKGGKMTIEEVEARKEIMGAIITEFHQAYKHAKGMTHAGDADNEQGGLGMATMTKDQLMKGSFQGAGVKVKRQELTGEQAQVLAAINEQSREQDMILDEISKGLDDLKDVAERMHDELQLQDKMLSDLESKTDKTQDKLDKVNERMTDAMKKINDKASNICIYIICVVLLLGIATVAYNLMKKKSTT